MRIRFLFDENLDPRFLRTMQRHYPEIDVDKNMAYKRLADALFVYWDSSELEDWQDQTEWIAV
jgi:hypothetical protein